MKYEPLTQGTYFTLYSYVHSNLQSDNNDKNEDEVDDLITLRGCGRITQWRFPSDITRCPVHRCPHTFHSRAKAINHYKEKHANYAILCPICEKPIAAHSKHGFISHYEKWHAYQKVPYNLYDENTDNSDDPADATVKVKKMNYFLIKFAKV